MGKRFYAKYWFLTLVGFFSALAFTSFLNIQHWALLVGLYSHFPFQKYPPPELILWDLGGNIWIQVQPRELLGVACALFEFRLFLSLIKIVPRKHLAAGV